MVEGGATVTTELDVVTGAGVVDGATVTSVFKVVAVVTGGEVVTGVVVVGATVVGAVVVGGDVVVVAADRVTAMA